MIMMMIIIIIIINWNGCGGKSSHGLNEGIILTCLWRLRNSTKILSQGSLYPTEIRIRCRFNVNYRPFRLSRLTRSDYLKFRKMCFFSSSEVRLAAVYYNAQMKAKMSRCRREEFYRHVWAKSMGIWTYEAVSARLQRHGHVICPQAEKGNQWPLRLSRLQRRL